MEPREKFWREWKKFARKNCPEFSKELLKEVTGRYTRNKDANYFVAYILLNIKDVSAVYIKLQVLERGRNERVPGVRCELRLVNHWGFIRFLHEKEKEVKERINNRMKTKGIKTPVELFFSPSYGKLNDKYVDVDIEFPAENALYDIDGSWQIYFNWYKASVEVFKKVFSDYHKEYIKEQREQYKEWLKK